MTPSIVSGSRHNRNSTVIFTPFAQLEQTHARLPIPQRGRQEEVVPGIGGGDLEESVRLRQRRRDGVTVLGEHDDQTEVDGLVVATVHEMPADRLRLDAPHSGRHCTHEEAAQNGHSGASCGGHRMGRSNNCSSV